MMGMGDMQGLQETTGGTPVPALVEIHPDSLASLVSLRISDSALSKKWPCPESGAGSSWCSVAFDSNGKVKSMDIGGQRLKALPSDESVYAKLDALETLNLGGTDLPIEHVARVLSGLPSLKTIYLGGNGLGDDGIKSLVEAVRGCPNRRLERIDLRYNDVGPKGAASIASLIGSEGTIRYLHLEGNDIGDEGLKALAAALGETGSSLEEIFIGDNKIGPEGAKSLASAMKTNRSLSKIYLEGNRIGHEGADSFSEVLEAGKENGGNSTVKNIFADNNGMGKPDTMRLSKALKSPTAIDDSAFT